jgi:rare lipoprotein A
VQEEQHVSKLQIATLAQFATPQTQQNRDTNRMPTVRSRRRFFGTLSQSGTYGSIVYFVLWERVVYRTALILAFLLSMAAGYEAESGLASYYGGRGHRGEMTCAHRTRPFGSIVTVTHAGLSIQCRVNDRGPFVRGRVIDVSVSAARALGMMRSGVVRVSVE